MQKNQAGNLSHNLTVDIRVIAWPTLAVFLHINSTFFCWAAARALKSADATFASSIWLCRAPAVESLR